MKRKIKILFLYAEVMGYTVVSFRELVKTGAEITVVHWDKQKLTPYVCPELEGVKMISRSAVTAESMIGLAEHLCPDITFISGWQDKDYLRVVRVLRKKGQIVVAGFDDQWFGTFRQFIAEMLGRFGFFKRFFSHAWVTGSRQFEYARRIGFKKEEIVFDLTSADLPLFHSVYFSAIDVKRKTYPHRFLFVGRFNQVKGIDVLIEAWNIIGERKKDWTLQLIGNGAFLSDIDMPDDVLVQQFLQPEQLANESMHAGCFVLPSNSEPWGVVVHEFAAAGMPLILSDAVGAGGLFLIPGMNGYIFPVADSNQLARQMLRIIETPDSELIQMSEYSYLLSTRITPETSARNLISLLTV